MKLPFRKSRAPAALEPRISIPEVWSDERGIAVRGWILTPHGPPETLEIIVDDTPIPVLSWHPRPKIAAKHPEFCSGDNCGFWAYLPRDPTHVVRVRARTAGEVFATTLRLPPTNKIGHAEAQTAETLFERFRTSVNNDRMSVLEIGSRVVVPGSESKRTLFPAAESYTGFDFYKDANTDVVGDAHRLSSYFDRQFDAVFSLAVFEHLAMPWLVALEINKVLRPGGLTFHQTHFAFPLHEQPADYWRFTAQGLRALFSPGVGFDHAECEYSDPASLHPARRTPEIIHLPGEPAFIQVAVLARKTAEIDDGKTRWSCELSSAVESQYPKPAPAES